MYVHRSEQAEIILKWGYRLLYVELFIFVIVSMHYWFLPFTFPFLGAILSLYFVSQVWKKEEGQKHSYTIAEE